MERLWIPMIVTLFSFGGLLLGGVVGLATRQLIEEKMYRLYALCGGILLGLLLEIIPETFSSFEMIGPILGISLGALLMMLMDNYCHHPMIHKKDQQAWQTFLFLSFAIFIHNMPSGFALGAAFANHHESAIPFLLAIIIHHIPEGLALMISFLFTQNKSISFILTILLLSVILGVGTVFGIMMNGKAVHLQGFTMGSAIGSLGYVTIHEMLWKAKKRLSILPFLSWTLFGFLLITIFTLFAGHH